MQIDTSRTTKFLEVKDHSVSGEIFQLYHDREFDLLITTPQPSSENLPNYYESDAYISHTDGRKSIFEIAYQTAKTIALRRKLKLVSKLAKNRSLLDIGAGTGDFVKVAKNSGWKVAGSEPSSKAREIAKPKGIELNNDTSSIADTFDVITMWHVLEHVSDLDYQIQELKRLIKPDGTIIIAVPNFKSFDAKHYKEFWAAFDVPRHLWHFSKMSITKLFDVHQMTVEAVLPMKFDAYYVSLLSEKYRTGNMRPFAAFKTAFKSNSEGKRTGEYSSHIYIIKNK